ncbi:MAG TPA: hypothetical protein VGH34_12545 [Vicinamibacterales bacterium]
MTNILLHDGPPPLTSDAADAAIDAIDFIAAVVRGVDLIDVTPIVRPLWRTHLATWYPYLPPPTRAWYANAPMILQSIRMQFPILQPWQQAQVVQQWAFELPQMLAMLDPVLAQAQSIAMSQAAAAQVTQLRQMATSAAPAYTPPSFAQASNEVSRQNQMTTSLQAHNTRMADLTVGLMRAMNHH